MGRAPPKLAPIHTGIEKLDRLVAQIVAVLNPVLTNTLLSMRDWRVAEDTSTPKNLLLQYRAAATQAQPSGAWTSVLQLPSTGVLPVASGGTNSSTALSNNRLIVSSGGKIVEEAAGSNGQVQTQVAGVPTWSNTIGGNTTISGTLTVSTALAAGLTQEAWIAFPYAANWSDYAGNMAGGYFKDSVGVVHLRGFTKYALTTGGSGITVGTLPAGYRPNAAIHFATTNYNGAAFVAPMTISVNSAGAVTVDGFVNGGVANTSGVGLDGVTFDTR